MVPGIKEIGEMIKLMELGPTQTQMGPCTLVSGKTIYKKATEF